MAVKKIEELNIHRDVNSTEQFDVQDYLNENWDKMQDVVDNNAEELMQAQKDISTLKEDNKTNKSSIDVLEKSNETRDGKISKNTENIEAIQGSIKTAIETINKKDNEQDEDIKANKESIKEIQAENERFREDIKSIATIGEASGENIHLEDSSEARCEIEICGNQKQETREGYNQLKNEGTTQTLNNVTITKKEDETLFVNGTDTEDFTFSIKRNIELEDGEQYKLSGCPNGGAEKKYALTINQYYENQSHFGQDYGDGVNFTYNGSLPINNNIYIRLFKGITYNNLIFKPMIVKGTENKPYEQYGASPSIDYPSKVKSVNGSAKVDIVNENIFNTENVKSTSAVSVVDNKNGVLELQGVSGFWKEITTTQKFETGKRVYVKCKVVEGTGSSGNIGIKDTNGDDILENYKVSNNLISCSFISKGITKIFFRCNGASNTGHIKYSDIMFSYEDIDYIPHQEQSYLVDVQQEMLEGDTFIRQDGKWYEKHCWKKMLLNGTEKIGVSGVSTNEILGIVYDINNAVDGFGYSDYFLYSSQIELNKMTVYNGGKSLRVYVSRMQFADLESYKAKLKELYEAGTPVIIYYKLAEPILLECTEAQSKVLDEIYSKAHTYKNITNISAESSEVNPIVSLKYLKDVETEHNKLQAQIDEIKQLLSTTETSEMLLNNMQTDLESEV